MKLTFVLEGKDVWQEKCLLAFSCSKFSCPKLSKTGSLLCSISVAHQWLQKVFVLRVILHTNSLIRSNTSDGETLQDFLKDHLFLHPNLNSISAVKNGNWIDSFHSAPYSHFPTWILRLAGEPRNYDPLGQRRSRVAVSGPAPPVTRAASARCCGTSQSERTLHYGNPE